MVEILKKIYHSQEKTLLACSGGPDSTALFYLLLELKKRLSGFDFQVFHLNHGLREALGDRDAFFVQDLCQKNAILYHGKKENVAAFAMERGLSLEEAGRKIRYRNLNQIKESQGLNSITTAHHADDQTELFLMRLFQGAGVGALTGMKERQGVFVRPLLSIGKKEILEFLQANKIDYQLDETNLSQKFLRNKIRNLLIPVVSEIFPVYQKKIQQLQSMLYRQEKFIASSLIEWSKIRGQTFLSCGDFKRQPEEIQRDQLVLGLKSLSENFYLSSRHIENIIFRINMWSGEGHKIFLETGDFLFLGTQGVLFFVSREWFEKKEPDCVIGPGERKKMENFVVENCSMAIFKFRESRPGERIRFEKTKKLQDFLTDHKIFYHWRKKVRVIETEEEQFAGILEPVSGKLFLRKEFQNVLKLSAQTGPF